MRKTIRDFIKGRKTIKIYKKRWKHQKNRAKRLSKMIKKLRTRIEELENAR